MKYSRLVIGYHGCERETAEEVLFEDAELEASNNPYDWLGRGIYFWEYGHARAWQFAKDHPDPEKTIGEPAVVGAIIQLGDCFDLLDTRFTDDLSDAYPSFQDAVLDHREEPLQNVGDASDHALRYLDCAYLNWYLGELEKEGTYYYTVRGGFTEGGPVFPGSGIQRQTHIQIAVRNPACIVGVFRPTQLREGLE